MSLITIDRDPTPRTLWWFAALLPIFFGLVGTMRWHAGSARSATVLWIVGLVLTIAAFAHVAARRAIYRTWTTATWPIGWAVSHLLLFAIYAFVATPTALVMRALGRDPMQRGFDRQASTYWIARDPEVDRSRYFRQS
jgi:hypothetical protein